MGELTRQEFIDHIRLVRDDIKEVNDRLDLLNGRTRTTEQKIAVLESQRPAPDHSKAGAIGAVGGGVIVAAAEIVRAWWK